MSIALAIDDSLAIAIATIRGKAVLRTLNDLVGGGDISDGMTIAIARTVADYERVQDATSAIAILGRDRVRMLRWLEHRSRREADLFGTRARDAQLGLLSFFELSLIECQFERVAMAGSFFVRARLDDCDLQGSDLRRTVWDDAQVTRCNFEDADLSGANLDGATFIECSFLVSVRWTAPGSPP